MLVPSCINCGNRTLVLGPKGTLEDEIRAYCPECRAYYALQKDTELNLPVLDWVQI
jgi:hypothetical protein